MDQTWIFTAGATALLLSVGALIYQVRSHAEEIARIKEAGSPASRARICVLEATAITQQKQLDLLTADVKAALLRIEAKIDDFHSWRKKDE